MTKFVEATEEQRQAAGRMREAIWSLILDPPASIGASVQDAGGWADAAVWVAGELIREVIRVEDRQVAIDHLAARLLQSAYHEEGVRPS